MRCENPAAAGKTISTKACTEKPPDCRTSPCNDLSSVRPTGVFSSGFCSGFESHSVPSVLCFEGRLQLDPLTQSCRYRT